MLSDSHQFTIQGLPEIMSLYLIDTFFIHEFLRVGFRLVAFRNLFMQNLQHSGKKIFVTQLCSAWRYFFTCYLHWTSSSFPAGGTPEQLFFMVFLVACHTEVLSLSLIMLLAFLCPFYISAMNWNRINNLPCFVKKYFMISGT